MRCGIRISRLHRLKYPWVILSPERDEALCRIYPREKSLTKNSLLRHRRDIHLEAFPGRSQKKRASTPQPKAFRGKSQKRKSSTPDILLSQTALHNHTSTMEMKISSPNLFSRNFFTTAVRANLTTDLSSCRPFENNYYNISETLDTALASGPCKSVRMLPRRPWWSIYTRFCTWREKNRATACRAGSPNSVSSKKYIPVVISG